MTLDEYQKQASKTAKNHGKEDFTWLTYCIIGLSGEVGEIQNKFKKSIRDDNCKLTNSKRLELKAEIGDAAWYLSQVASALGFSLNEICEENIEKLASRAKRGKIGGSGDHR